MLLHLLPINRAPSHLGPKIDHALEAKSKESDDRNRTTTTVGRKKGERSLFGHFCPYIGRSPSESDKLKGTIYSTTMGGGAPTREKGDKKGP